MAASRGQVGLKYRKCMKMLNANLALVLLVERTDMECGKGLLDYSNSARSECKIAETQKV